MSFLGDLTLVPSMVAVLEAEGGTKLATQVPNMGIELEFGCDMDAEECANVLNDHFDGESFAGAKLEFEGWNQYGTPSHAQGGVNRTWFVTTDPTANEPSPSGEEADEYGYGGSDEDYYDNPYRDEAISDQAHQDMSEEARDVANRLERAWMKEAQDWPEYNRERRARLRKAVIEKLADEIEEGKGDPSFINRFAENVHDKSPDSDSHDLMHYIQGEAPKRHADWKRGDHVYFMDKDGERQSGTVDWTDRYHAIIRGDDGEDHHVKHDKIDSRAQQELELGQENHARIGNREDLVKYIERMTGGGKEYDPGNYDEFWGDVLYEVLGWEDNDFEQFHDENMKEMDEDAGRELVVHIPEHIMDTDEKWLHSLWHPRHSDGLDKPDFRRFLEESAPDEADEETFEDFSADDLDEDLDWPSDLWDNIRDKIVEYFQENDMDRFYEAASEAYDMNHYDEDRGGSADLGRHGIEMVSPRIAMTNTNIKRASQIFSESLRACDGTSHPGAGMHVHLGFRRGLKPIHLLKLAYSISGQEDIEGKAGRSFRHYAKETVWFTHMVDQAVERGINSKDAQRLLADLKAAATQVKGDKYQVINFSGKGTAEMRIGSSELADDPRQMAKWLEHVRDSYREAVQDDWFELPEKIDVPDPENPDEYDEKQVRVGIETGGQIEIQIRDNEKAEWQTYAKGRGGKQQTHSGLVDLQKFREAMAMVSRIGDGDGNQADARHAPFWKFLLKRDGKGNEVGDEDLLDHYAKDIASDFEFIVSNPRPQNVTKLIDRMAQHGIDAKNPRWKIAIATMKDAAGMNVKASDAERREAANLFGHARYDDNPTGPGGSVRRRQRREDMRGQAASDALVANAEAHADEIQAHVQALRDQGDDDSADMIARTVSRLRSGRPIGTALRSQTMAWARQNLPQLLQGVREAVDALEPIIEQELDLQDAMRVLL